PIAFAHGEAYAFPHVKHTRSSVLQGRAAVGRSLSRDSWNWVSRIPRHVSAQEWESSIRAFEREDKVHPVPPGGIVFTGSSSIAYWSSLVEDMKPLAVI